MIINIRQYIDIDQILGTGERQKKILIITLIQIFHS